MSNVTPINFAAEMAEAAATRDQDEYNAVMSNFKSRYGTFNGDVVDLSTGQVLQLNRALKEWGAESAFRHENVDGDRTVNPINELFAHADRVKIVRFYMDPVNPVFGHTGQGRFNTFTGWWREPVYGAESVEPWTKFVAKVLEGIEGADEFVHNWVAQIVQRPWEKNYTVITLAGKTEGTGKSLLAKSVAEMLGTANTNQGLLKPAPALCTSGDKIFSNFNKQLEGKVLVVADELGSNKAQHSAVMKDLVTSSSLTVEAKFKDSYTQRNYLNFILTTNNVTATLVDEFSRRDVILSVQQQDVGLMRKLAGEFVAWAEDGGYELMLGWYFQRDITMFDAMARAPRFVGWEDSVNASKSKAQVAQDALVEAIQDFKEPIQLSRWQCNEALKALGFEHCDVDSVLRTMSQRKEVFVRFKSLRDGGGVQSGYLFNGEASSKLLKENALKFLNTNDSPSNF